MLKQLGVSLVICGFCAIACIRDINCGTKVSDPDAAIAVPELSPDAGQVLDDKICSSDLGFCDCDPTCCEEFGDMDDSGCFMCLSLQP
jgi:hypothetical protein